MSNTKSEFLIRALRPTDLSNVKEFTDVSIGQNYYSVSELEDIVKRSAKDGVMCSFVLVETRPDGSEHIAGIRLTYPPGNWSKGKGARLRPDLWGADPDRTAYFQSLFLADHVQGQGWGQRLSRESIQALSKINTDAIVTHSWRESPNNSSVKYLQKLGFKTVAVHHEYWKDVDYYCTRDGKPCLCTAEEMILKLSDFYSENLPT